MAKKAVVLLSGGIDSSVCLYLAKRKGFIPHCLIFDYGQRHKKEIACAKRIARQAKAAFLVCRIKFPWRGSSLLDQRIKIPQRGRGIPSTYVPARNIIFLSFAVSFAEAIGAKAVFIGANARDFSGYPDCRPSFYRAFDATVKSGLKNRDLRVLTPLLYKTKAQIIKLGRNLGVHFDLSWSCYRGRNKPCARCDACRFRAKGFRRAGLKDPLL